MATPLQSSTKDDILRYLLRKGETSSQALADDLGISAQAVRRHLKDLEAERLIVHQPVSSGMGRPQYVYQLTDEGRSYFPEAYDRFALDLLDTLTETVSPEQFQTILRQQWQRKGQDYHHQMKHLPLEQRVKRLVELRRAEGYMTDWHLASPEFSEAEVTDPSDTKTAAHPNPGAAAGEDHSTVPAFVVTEYNCAIANVSKSFPSICDYELELYTQALGEDCQVERTHWMIEGEHRCGYLIQERSGSGV